METMIDAKYEFGDIVEIEYLAGTGVKHQRIGAVLAIRVTMTDNGNSCTEYKVKERFFPEDSVVGRLVRKE